ncbi:MAG: GtrA family protein [Candidatus Thermoplasmatota archaeon]|nr:GtrA family protein [Candidatus Thermoplasmatota archaeon]MCL5730698.1 GtrA family protein [Candidatus Thermoplasmatota archaeon]
MSRISLQVVLEEGAFDPENIVGIAKEENLDMDLFIIDPGSRTIKGYMSDGGITGNVKSSGNFIKDIQNTLKRSEGDFFAVVRSDKMCSMPTLMRMITKAEEGYDVVVASRFPGKRKFDVKTAIIKLLVREMNGISDPLSPFFIARRDLIENIDLSTSPETILPEIIIRNRKPRVAEVKADYPGRGRVYSGSFILYCLSLLKLSNYRALKFALVGITGIAINEGAEYVFHSYTGFIIPVALFLSIELSIIWNFIFNNAWTFSDRKSGGFLYKLGKYNAVTALGAAINYGVGIGLATIVFYLYANLLGIFIGFLVNYLGSDYLVWKIEANE